MPLCGVVYEAEARLSSSICSYEHTPGRLQALDRSRCDGVMMRVLQFSALSSTKSNSSLD